MRHPLTARPYTDAANPYLQRRAATRLITTMFFLVLAFFFCARCNAQDPDCKIIPSGQEFWVRLTDPVSTYSSKRGATVGAILIESPRCHEAPVFPTGIAVRGRITYLRKVGMGVLHESSAVTIDFDQILAGPKPLAAETRVEEVANGREDVKKGMIKGVGGRETPQALMTTRLLHLPFWSPESYWIFLLRRALFPYSPEPEIYLPAGTDLRLRLTAALELPSDLPIMTQTEAENSASVDTRISEKLLTLPERSATRKGQPSDTVNLAFLGSEEEIERAFRAAGWTYGDAVSTLSVLREMRAVSSLNNYSHLPISKQWLSGQASDFTLQKSFDSYQKREHIRFWNQSALEPDLWASGAIRETSAAWSFRRRKFIHHVDADLAAEREKVVRDLSLTGCVDNIYRLQRPDMPGRLKNAGGDTLWSDGRIAVVQLNDCEAPDAFRAPGIPQASRPRSRWTRFARAQILSIHDLWRSNAIYASFDLSRMFIGSMRDRSLQHRRIREYETKQRNAAVQPVSAGGN
jgi:LssY-like putative type I secretion system component LssY